MTAPPRLRQLIELAREPSSARRRELLREVTDLFFGQAPEIRSAEELEHFDAVLGRLLQEMELEVRAELAGRMADSPSAASIDSDPRGRRARSGGAGADPLARPG